jgi:hypothetical protein
MLHVIDAELHVRRDDSSFSVLDLAGLVEVAATDINMPVSLRAFLSA